MDVRCEKCQTEYELDEARLKPGGVTVKCTNCGHMFKIRKRSNTNVGAVPPVVEAPRNKPPSKPAGSFAAQPQQTAAGPGFARGDSILDEPKDGPTTVERQWLIRLENGEQKSCRELATLQQWIVANVVGRESLISRTGKTWKRLGDIAELAQYFDIADEARTTRQENPKPLTKPPVVATMLGLGNVATAAGGTILPDDDEQRTTPRKGATTPPPVPRVTKTPPVGVPAAAAPRRPLTQPPPPPPKKATSQSGPLPTPPKPSIPAPVGNRATAAWASDQIMPEKSSSGPSGPFVGKLSAIPDEPAFAGRVRTSPSSESSFDTDRVVMPKDPDHDDDSVLPSRRGSSAGLWILLVVLLVGGAATAGLYFFVFRKPEQVAKPPADASTMVAQVDAAPVVTPLIDAPVPVSPAEAARHELATDNETRLQAAYDALAGKDEPESLALRSLFGSALAQASVDRAGVVGDKAEADKLRKQAKTIVLDAATAAQKAHKATPDDPAANLAYAHVLRLQNKPAKDVKRFLDTAKAKAGDWARDVALAEALLLAREGKLDDAKTAFAAIDAGDGKLEVSNDVRARFHLALIALAQNKPAEAKPLVDQILAAQPDHAAARALSAKLDTLVAKTDPLPPEDPKNGSGGSGSGSNVAVGPGSGSGSAGSGTKPPPDGGGATDYDGYVKRADAIADSNCAKANDLYAKALEIKPNGVEALTGQGYCALEAKNFATAHRKFSTALATAPRYEPALAGIAETYTLQSRKEDAISAWRRYLDAFPGSAKAQKAIDRLGATSGTPPVNPGSGSTGTGSGSDTTQPPPPPPPTPPAGSGSG